MRKRGKKARTMYRNATQRGRRGERKGVAGAQEESSSRKYTKRLDGPRARI
jgi:hypothetical protein